MLQVWGPGGHFWKVNTKKISVSLLQIVPPPGFLKLGPALDFWSNSNNFNSLLWCELIKMIVHVTLLCMIFPKLRGSRPAWSNALPTTEPYAWVKWVSSTHFGMFLLISRSLTNHSVAETTKSIQDSRLDTFLVHAETLSLFFCSHHASEKTSHFATFLKKRFLCSKLACGSNNLLRAVHRGAVAACAAPRDNTACLRVLEVS